MKEDVQADWVADLKSGQHPQGEGYIYKCLAFRLNNSNGTANCMEQARTHGIPVSPFEKWS
jgi:hypothetical protein